MAKTKRKGKNAGSRHGGGRPRLTAVPAVENASVPMIDGLERTLTDQTASPADLERLAAQCMASKNYEQASRVFRRISQTRPDDPQPYTDLATSLAMTGRLEEARRCMARAVSLAPDNAKFLANLAKVMIMQGDFLAAREVIQQALPLAGETRHNELLGLMRLCEQSLADQAGLLVADESLTPVALPTQPAPVAVAPTPPASVAPAAPAALASQPRRPQPLERTDSPLNILFVQEAPCIRNYKTASALRARGHKVCLAYTKARLSQMYKGLSDDVYDRCLKLRDYRHLWDISAQFDIVHCHNEPDLLSVTALAGDAPVVHDTHDLISLRAGGDANLAFFEGMANRGAHGRVYTTPYQRDVAQKLYGVKGPSLVFYNYTSAGDLPRRFLPKLSASDGQTHIVYEGGIGGNGHRDFIDLFVELASGGLHVHIYPVHFDQAMAQRFAPHALVHYHQPQSPKDIIERMSQYDIGIIPFNIVKGNKQFLDSTIANKLFEYLAAGLPVLASPLRSYVDYFRENPVGKVFNSGAEAMAAVPELLTLAAKIDLPSYAKTYDGEVIRLEEFYRQIIAAYHAGDAPSQQAAPGVFSVPDGLGGLVSFQH